jgi:phage/plasmid-associated DNA primase
VSHFRQRATPKRDIGRGHDGLSDFLQLVAGYSMSASTREDLIVLFDGPGGSRKTSFCDSVRSTIGEYGHVAPFDMFTQRKGSPRRRLARHRAPLRAREVVHVVSTTSTRAPEKDCLQEKRRDLYELETKP